MAELVRVERLEGDVALVRIDRPPMNTLSGMVLDELAVAAHDLKADGTAKAVVVTGSGDRAFAAGADVNEFGDGSTARAISRRFRAAFDALGAIPRPVIAAVNGFALGGGLELAMACDLRIAADSARLGQPEILLGIIPGAGATQRLPRLVGPARAKELIWTGRQLLAGEALSIGLVDRVVPAADLVDAALEWGRSLSAGAVVAMGLAKHAIDAAFDRPLAAGLDAESDAFVEVFGTADARTGVRSFLEHGPGKATFTGR